MDGMAVRKPLIAGLGAVVLALALAGAALAAGGGEGPAPIRLATPAFAVDGAGHLLMTSTVSCDLPGEAWIYALALQNVGVGGPGSRTRVHGLQVTGTYNLDVICPEADAVLDVSGIISADLARGFRPGEATVYLEFASDAVNPDTTHTYGFMFGYLFLNGTDYPELRPTG